MLAGCCIKPKNIQLLLTKVAYDLWLPIILRLFKKAPRRKYHCHLVLTMVRSRRLGYAEPIEPRNEPRSVVAPNSTEHVNDAFMTCRRVTWNALPVVVICASVSSSLCVNRHAPADAASEAACAEYKIAM